MNENDAYIFDIEEPLDWVFDGNPVWISGWFLSKNGAVFSDIKATIDGVPHMGLWALPREQIERKYRGYFGLPHAGFALKINPSKDSHMFKLELLDEGGRWVEIWRKVINPKTRPSHKAELNAAIIPDQLNKLLQARRAHPDADLGSLAIQLTLESSAVPLNTLPNPPFFGCLENPLLTGGSQFGKLKVEGWVIHEQQKIHRLIATTHPLAENEMDYGDRERVEAGLLFPNHPYAGRSQFFGMVDIDATAGDPACLKIFADLEDGSRHLIFAHRFYQRACVQQEKPLPEFSRGTISGLAILFVQACRKQHISLGKLGPVWAGFRKAFQNYRRFAPDSLTHRQKVDLDPYAAWVQVNQLTDNLQHTLRKTLVDIEATGPRFTVVIDTRGCCTAHLKDLATSLERQLYPNWEAWFIGEQPVSSRDQRFHSEPIHGPKDFIRASNAAVHQSEGSHLLYVPGHARLSPDALSEISLLLAQSPKLELVYTDEDRMDDSGARCTPIFKPEWSPAMAISGLFPGYLSVIRRERFIAIGSFGENYDEVPWLDALLRLGDSLTSSKVAHVPMVCYHHRDSISRQIDLAHVSVEQERQALADTMRRRSWSAQPFLPEIACNRKERFHQLRWDPDILKRLQVTIVIPTRDRLHLLQECIELLDETVDWRYVKLIIVDDHSRDADIVRYFAAIQKRPDLMCTVIQPPDAGAPFNYSKLVNTALSIIDTPLILHLNNDVNALERGWLEEMVGWFTLHDVGIVGAKLVYPEKTLNHTGIVIGPHGGLADTPFTRMREELIDPAWHAVAREVSAVTGACLMTRTSLYRELGGFDEKDFGVSYNDVDYCLRVCAAGQRVIYTPQAKLMHWGSATRGVTFDEAEHIAFLNRYSRFIDPYFSANWQLREANVVCTGARHVRPERAGKLRVLLLTHNLNLEGAPLFIFEYAHWLVREAGFTVEVLSPKDGPLRSSFAELGAKITLIDTNEIYASPDEEIFHSRVADISYQFEWDKIDLVVCNTLVNFWGVHLAKAGGKPSLFYIHESTSVFRFFEQTLKLELHHLVADAFHQCTRALFLCKATRAYYEDYNLHGNYRIISSWVRINDIEQFRMQHTRPEMRKKHGIKEDEIVIANIGTVCERKGQQTFIRAIDHFNHHFGHRGKFRFFMVGARPGIFLDLLLRDLNRLNLTNVTLVPETPDVFDFFVGADMFVCSSFEESFPRVVMEAMAFRTPIVTTDVHGISELVQQRADAYLVPPGDHIALSRMMWTCIAKERSGKSLTPTAFSKALRYRDHRKVLRRHVEMAQEAYLM